MDWYFSSFVVHREVNEAALVLQLREYGNIFRANNSSGAYDKSIEIAEEIITALNMEQTGAWILDGISELLRVEEPPAPGSELIWQAQELRPHELETWMRAEGGLSRQNALSVSLHSSGWYVAELVLVETHDTGSHGDTILVWTNLHLITAEDALSARRVARDFGTKQAASMGSHHCSEDTAHWEFKGVRSLRQTINPPYDGATLWFNDLECPVESLCELIPPRSSLGIFEWEARLQRE